MVTAIDEAMVRATDISLSSVASNFFTSLSAKREMRDLAVSMDRRLNLALFRKRRKKRIRNDVPVNRKIIFSFNDNFMIEVKSIVLGSLIKTY